MPYWELKTAFDGAVLYARPEFRLDPRAGAATRARGWFWGSLFGQWRIHGLVVLATVLVNLLALAVPIFAMNVFDRAIPNHAEETLWVLATGVAIFLAFDFVLRTLRAYFVDSAGKTADIRIAGRLYQRFLGMTMAARPASAGAAAGSVRAFDDLGEIYKSSMAVAAADAPFIVFFIVAIYVIGGPVAFTPLAAATAVIVLQLLLYLPLRAAVERSAREARQRLATLVETFGGMEIIKGAGAESRMQRNWEALADRTSRGSARVHSLAALVTNFTGTAANFVIVGVLVHGAYLIDAGTLSVGGLVAVTILAARAMAALGQVAEILTRYHRARVATTALDRTMRAPVERPEGRDFVRRAGFSGAIEFRDVGFRYPGQEAAVLENLSFRVRPGEKIGLVGPMGSGKTTIARLVLGLYEASDGAVIVDGADVRKTDPAELRRHIGSAPQDAQLFFGSIRDNIALGAPFIDDEAIHRAAWIAGADGFADRHPMGYDMPVGEGGQAISRGQRQAIAIARAMLRDPSILLFDEPASSMDSASEDRFKSRLTSVMGDKTLVLVTNRASMLSLVDRLIVIDRGRIVADGTKQEVFDILRRAGIQESWS